MAKTTNVKGEFAIDIIWIVIIAGVIAAIIVIFCMSTTGALDNMAYDIGSSLSSHLPHLP